MKKLKIYLDGGARGNPGLAAIGFVIKDATNQIISQRGQFIGKATNNQAEYQALIAVFNWLKDYQQTHQKSLEQVDLFLDSQLVVKQMQGIYKIKSAKIKFLWQKAKELESKLWPLKIYYHLIPRSLNWQADCLLNQALDLLK